MSTYVVLVAGSASSEVASSTQPLVNASKPAIVRYLMRALSYIILLGGQGLTVALLTGCPRSESAATSTDGGSATPTASASQVTLAPLDTSTPIASTSAGPTAPVATLGGGGIPPI